MKTNKIQLFLSLFFILSLNTIFAEVPTWPMQNIYGKEGKFVAEILPVENTDLIEISVYVNLKKIKFKTITKNYTNMEK